MRSRLGLWVLCGCQAVLTAGVALSFPFFAIYMHRDRGASMGLVGLCLSASVLATAVSQGLGGELSDVWGRRTVMVLSLIARAATALWLAAGIGLRWSLSSVVLLHIFSNFCSNFYDPAARGWVADHFGPEERTQAFGLLRMGVNAGWAVGPALGGLMAQRSYSSLFVATSVVCGACTLLAAAFVRDKPVAVAARGFRLGGTLQAAQDLRFLRFCAFDVLIALVMAQLVVTVSVHSTQFVGLSERQVGMLFSLNGLLVVVLQYPLGLFWKRWRLSTSLAAGSVLYAAGYASMGFSRNMAAMLAAVAVVTLGEVVVSPGLHAVAANMAPVEARGRYLGFLGLAHQMGSAFGPLTGGLGLNYLSPFWIPGPWVIVGCVALAAAGGFFSMGRVLTLEEQGATEEP